MNITYGADQEVFLYDNTQKKIVSAIPVLKCDKYNPILLGRNKDIKMYADNVLVEFAFPPCHTKSEIVARFAECFTEGKKFLGERYDFLAVASHKMDESELQDEAAKAIGCNPNFNFYTENMNEVSPFLDNLRTGSCHIHLGATELLDFDVRHQAMRLLDIFVGCSSILFNQDDSSLARRNLYGKSGEFRPTPYGGEYRILSNFCLRSEDLIKLVLDLVEYSMSFVEKNRQLEILALVESSKVREAIDTENKELAEQVLRAAQLPMSFLNRVKQNYHISSQKVFTS